MWNCPAPTTSSIHQLSVGLPAGGTLGLMVSSAHKAVYNVCTLQNDKLKKRTQIHAFVWLDILLNLLNSVFFFVIFSTNVFGCFFQGDRSVNQHLLTNLRNSRRGLHKRKRLKEKKHWNYLSPTKTAHTTLDVVHCTLPQHKEHEYNNRIRLMLLMLIHINKQLTPKKKSPWNWASLDVK